MNRRDTKRLFYVRMKYHKVYTENHAMCCYKEDNISHSASHSQTNIVEAPDQPVYLIYYSIGYTYL